MTQKIYLLLTIIFIGIGSISSQTDYARTAKPDFEKEVDSYLRYSIPAITVKNLVKIKDQVIIFDAREKEEYDVSHIPGAQYIGYNSFDKKVLNGVNKDQRIVVYCSIGYRSEKIGEKLKEEGYINTYNLFGSIFEWVNEGQPIEDNNGETTNKVHTYNKEWSKWIYKENIKKVW